MSAGFRKIGVIMAAILMATSLSGAPGSFAAVKKTQVMVSAAASLTAPLNEIEKTYEKSHPNVDLVINYGSSGALQTQIENGAKVNIFISAAIKQMDELSKKGLIDDKTKVNILGNKLVLIANAKNTKINKFSDLVTDAAKKIALGEPKSVPAGKYAEEALKSAGLLDRVKGKAVYAKDVKGVLSWVEAGNADAGIVYYSDAKGNKKVRIVATANSKSHSPILYPAAMIKSGANASKTSAKEAGAFFSYLKGKQSKDVFVKYGFSFLLKVK